MKDSDSTVAGEEFSAVLAAGGGRIIVPGGEAFLLAAEFMRSGPDLILIGPDGQQILIVGFFQGEATDLATEAGAIIDSQLAAKLAGPLAPGQFAQAEGMDLLAPIGKVSIANGRVEVRRGDGSRAELNVGDDIYQDDVVTTAQGGSVGLTFLDGTTFSLGSAGRMVLDEMVYDAGAQTGSASISVVSGAFTLVSGAIPKVMPDAMHLKTPAMTIGIRGTGVASDGTTVALMEERGGITGEITVTTPNGQTLTLNVAGGAVTVGPGGTLTASTLSPAQIGQLVGNALGALPNRENSLSQPFNDSVTQDEQQQQPPPPPPPLEGPDNGDAAGQAAQAIMMAAIADAKQAIAAMQQAGNVAALVATAIAEDAKRQELDLLAQARAAEEAEAAARVKVFTDEVVAQAAIAAEAALNASASLTDAVAAQQYSDAAAAAALAAQAAYDAAVLEATGWGALSAAEVSRAADANVAAQADKGYAEGYAAVAANTSEWADDWRDASVITARVASVAVEVTRSADVTQAKTAYDVALAEAEAKEVATYEPMIRQAGTAAAMESRQLSFESAYEAYESAFGQQGDGVLLAREEIVSDSTHSDPLVNAWLSGAISAKLALDEAETANDAALADVTTALNAFTAAKTAAGLAADAYDSAVGDLTVAAAARGTAEASEIAAQAAAQAQAEAGMSAALTAVATALDSATTASQDAQAQAEIASAATNAADALAAYNNADTHATNAGNAVTAANTALAAAATARDLALSNTLPEAPENALFASAPESLRTAALQAYETAQALYNEVAAIQQETAKLAAQAQSSLILAQQSYQLLGVAEIAEIGDVRAAANTAATAATEALTRAETAVTDALAAKTSAEALLVQLTEKYPTATTLLNSASQSVSQITSAYNAAVAARDNVAIQKSVAEDAAATAAETADLLNLDATRDAAQAGATAAKSASQAASTAASQASQASNLLAGARNTASAYEVWAGRAADAAAAQAALTAATTAKSNADSAYDAAVAAKALAAAALIEAGNDKQAAIDAVANLIQLGAGAADPHSLALATRAKQQADAAEANASKLLDIAEAARAAAFDKQALMNTAFSTLEKAVSSTLAANTNGQATSSHLATAVKAAEAVTIAATETQRLANTANTTATDSRTQSLSVDGHRISAENAEVAAQTSISVKTHSDAAVTAAAIAANAAKTAAAKLAAAESAAASAAQYLQNTDVGDYDTATIGTYLTAATQARDDAAAAMATASTQVTIATTARNSAQSLVASLPAGEAGTLARALADRAAAAVNQAESSLAAAQRDFAALDSAYRTAVEANAIVEQNRSSADLIETLMDQAGDMQTAATNSKAKAEVFLANAGLAVTKAGGGFVIDPSSADLDVATWISGQLGQSIDDAPAIKVINLINDPGVTAVPEVSAWIWGQLGLSDAPESVTNWMKVHLAKMAAAFKVADDSHGLALAADGLAGEALADIVELIEDEDEIYWADVAVAKSSADSAVGLAATASRQAQIAQAHAERAAQAANTATDLKAGYDAYVAEYNAQVAAQTVADAKPMAAADSETLDEDGSVNIDVLANDTDALGVLLNFAESGDGARVTSVGNPANGTSIINANGTITYTPKANYSGSDSFTYTISNTITVNGVTTTHTATGTVSITVTAVNDAPVVSVSTSALSYTEGTTISVTPTLTVTDVDSTSLTSATIIIADGFVSGQDQLNFTNQSGITGAFDTQSGVLTLTGTASLAAYQAALRTITYTNTSNNPVTANRTIEVSVFDGEDWSAAVSRTLTVTAINSPPVLTAPDPTIGAEDGILALNAATFTDAYSDPEGDAPVSIRIESLPANGTLRLDGVVITASQVIAAADLGNLTFVPNADWFGTTSFSWRASDGTDWSGLATFPIQITGVNDAPVLTGNATLPAIDEDPEILDGTSINSILAANFSDVDSSMAGIAVIANTADAVTEGVWQFFTGTGWADIGTATEAAAVALSADTMLMFVPVANYNGTPPGLVVRALDDTYAGEWSSDAGPFVTVDTTVNGGSTAISTGTSTIGITVNPTNDPPEFSAAVTMDPISNRTTDPAGATVSALFGPVFTDIDGDSLGGIAITAAYVINGTWQYSTDDGGSWHGVGDISDPYAALTLSASSMVRFVPNAGYSGVADSFFAVPVDDSYQGAWTSGGTRVTVDTMFLDPYSAIGSTSVQLSQTVDLINDTPEVAPFAVSGTEDTTLTIGAAPFLDAYSDADSDALVSVEIMTLATGGDLKLSGTVVTINQVITVADLPNLTFEPSPDWNGSTSFTWRAFDGFEWSASATADITIAAVNDPPVVTSIQGSALQFVDGDHFIVPTTLGVARFGGADSFSVVMDINPDPAGGTLWRQHAYDSQLEVITAVLPDGALRFAIGKQSTGWEWHASAADTITFNEWSQVAFVKDDATARIYLDGIEVYSQTIGATQLSSAPTVHTTRFGKDGESVYYNGALGSLKIYDAALGAAALADLAAGATISGDLLGDWRMGEGSGVTLADNSGVMGDITLTRVDMWTDREGNRFTLLEDGTASGTVLVSDVEGDTVSGVVHTQAAHGTVTYDHGTGTWTYTPDPDYNGSDSFILRFDDGQGGITDQTISLLIEPVNDAPVISGAVDLGAMSGATLFLATADLLANASDVDGDTLSVVNLSTVGDVGTFSPGTDGGGNPGFFFTPNEGIVGAVTINYDVTDGTAVTAATANLTVSSLAVSGITNAGGALVFDGAGLASTATDSVISTSVFSFEAWINPNSLDGTRTIFSKGSEFSLAIVDGVLRVSLLDHIAPGVQDFTLAVTTDTWSHVAVVCDGSEFQFYVNGEFAGGGATHPLVFGDAAAPLVLGGITSDGTAGFIGQMDDVRLWDVARTEAEIQSSFQLKEPATTDGLVANWTMDAVAGGEVLAANSGGPALTVTGARLVDIPVRAMAFDSVDDYVTLDADFAVGSGALTFEAWINTSNNVNRQAVLSLGGGGFREAGYLYVEGGTLRFDLAGQAGVNTGITVADGLWHHVAAVLNPAGTVTVYVDGNAVGSHSFDYNVGVEGGYYNIGDGPAVIGASYSYGTHYFQGLIADARIWDIARTPADIAGGMNVRPGDDEFGLLVSAQLDNLQTGGWTMTSGDMGWVSSNVYGSPILTETKPPSASDAIEVREDTPFNGQIVIEGPYSTLTIAEGGQPQNGKLMLNADGTFSYRPADDYVGSDSFTIIVTDDNEFSVTKTFQITVTEVDDPADLEPPPAHEHWGLEFHGGDSSYVNIDPAVATGTSPLTIEAWVRTGSTATMGLVILGNPIGNATEARLIMHEGKLHFSLSQTGLAQASSIIADDEWHHVAVTMSSSGEAVLYVDGIAETSYDFGVAYDLTELSASIGGSPQGGGFSGAISDVRIWTEERSTQQLIDGMVNPPDPADPALHAWWNFAEGSGTTVTDIAGGFNGTVMGEHHWTDDVYAAMAVDTVLAIDGAVIFDPDAVPNLPGTLRVVIEADHGVLTLGSTTGLTFIDGSANGTSMLAFTGSASDINAALAVASYQPNLGFTGRDGISFLVDEMDADLTRMNGGVMTVLVLGGGNVVGSEIPAVNGVYLFTEAMAASGEDYVIRNAEQTDATLDMSAIENFDSSIASIRRIGDHLEFAFLNGTRLTIENHFTTGQVEWMEDDIGEMRMAQGFVTESVNEYSEHLFFGPVTGSADIVGGAGEDYMIWQGGGGTYDGGGGYYNGVSFINAGTGVTVNLNLTAELPIEDYWATAIIEDITLYLKNVNEVDGTRFSDHMTARAGVLDGIPTEFRGYGGSDTFVGTNSAAFVLYDWALGGVSMYLDGGLYVSYAAAAGVYDAGADTLIDILGIVGSDFADNLDASGSTEFMVLDGGGGDDVLRAGANGAQMIGGTGRDIMYAGAGWDYFVWGWEDTDQNGTTRATTDVIVGFDIENDIIDLQHFGFLDLWFDTVAAGYGIWATVGDNANDSLLHISLTESATSDFTIYVDDVHFEQWTAASFEFGGHQHGSTVEFDTIGNELTVYGWSNYSLTIDLEFGYIGDGHGFDSEIPFGITGVDFSILDAPSVTIFGDDFLDYVIGGDGDDQINVLNGAFTSINGGAGIDTLAFLGEDMALLDLTGSAVTGIEIIDLGAFGAQTLVIDGTLAGSISDAINGATGVANSLVILGQGDTVDLAGGGWSETGVTDATLAADPSGASYSIYSHTDGAQVYVENGNTVTGATV